MIIDQIMQELQDIPEDKLAEIYNMIQEFRLGLNTENSQPRIPGLLTGELGDAFFEPLPEKARGDSSKY